MMSSARCMHVVHERAGVEFDGCRERRAARSVFGVKGACSFDVLVLE